MQSDLQRYSVRGNRCEILPGDDAAGFESILGRNAPYTAIMKGRNSSFHIGPTGPGPTRLCPVVELSRSRMDQAAHGLISIQQPFEPTATRTFAFLYMAGRLRSCWVH